MAKGKVSIKTKEVTDLVAPATTSLEDWGIEQKLTARDFTIPKIVALQAMSLKVVAGEAKMGELRDTLNWNILGDEKRPLEFIPFYMEKVYVVMQKKDGTFRFHHQEKITPETEEHPYECDSEEGVPQKWMRTTLFYVLLPSELSDGTGAIPYTIAFRSSSARAGSKLATTMYLKNLKAGKTPASMVMELSTTKTKNDKGTYMVLDVKEKRASEAHEVKEAFEWVKVVKAGKAKVDHSDLESEAVVTSVAPDSEDY